MNYIEKLKKITKLTIFDLSTAFWTSKKATLELDRRIAYLEETRLDKIISTNEITGRYLVNFKNPGYSFGGNDPLPAIIEPYKGRLSVRWENGWSSVIDAVYINIYLIS